MHTRFFAAQSVDIPVTDQPIPIQHYLRQPHRFVKALSPVNRIEMLGSDLFRLNMRPLNFMMLDLQPTVDLRVWADGNGVVHLRSERCEIRGVDYLVDYVNDRFSLNLVGQLSPIMIQHKTHLQGKAELEVLVELPPPFLLTPRPILETTGNGLLKSVLLTIKQRLMHQLISDYQTWATRELATGTGSNPVSRDVPVFTPSNS